MKQMKMTRPAVVPEQANEAPVKTMTKLNFCVFHASTSEVYHQVQGRDRKGLLIDPGAASGLVGSETLRNLQPYMIENAQYEFDKRTPVSGISGTSESTLGQVKMKLKVAGQPITYMADVLGGDGSLLPSFGRQSSTQETWCCSHDGMV